MPRDRRPAPTPRALGRRFQRAGQRPPPEAVPPDAGAPDLVPPKPGPPELEAPELGSPELGPPPAPRARARRGLAATAGALWLLVLGAAAVVIGGHDTVAGTELMVRVWGTLVLGAGCVLVAGAAGLWRGTPRGRSLAMVAALLGVALGAMTFLAQAVNDEPDRRLLAWTAIMLLSGACVWAVRSVTPPSADGEGLLSALPVLKSVVSLGVIASLAQFWYASIYIPTTAPASLTIETSIRSVRDGSRLVLMGSVTVRNTSGTRVNLLASTMRLAGEKMGAAADQEFEDDALEAHTSGTLDYVVRGQTTPEHTVVAAGPLLPDGFYLEPGETVTQPMNARVSAGRFDEATLDTAVVIARGRVLALETAAPAPPRRTSQGVVIVTPIPEAGWLRRLTRGDRYVRAEYTSDLRGIPAVRFVTNADAGPQDDESFHKRMWHFYGASFSVAQARVPLRPDP